jgi:hypothetical protein
MVKNPRREGRRDRKTESLGAVVRKILYSPGD